MTLETPAGALDPHIGNQEVESMFRRIQFAAAAAFTTAALAALALVVSMAGSAAASAPASAAGAKGARILLRSTSVGKILTTGNGFTVYMFTRDGHNKDRCAGISGCMQAWPMVTTHGRPQAGSGLKRSMLGTIKVAGKTQLTYAGHPLYGYVGDSSPGSTGYVNASAFGGHWPAVSASGKMVR
jgi:predicted lipoprotein with Yx(FWY)xxD motif